MISIMVLSGDFIGEDNGNLENPHKECPCKELPTDSTTLRKWKKIACDTFSNDFPLQVTMLTKRTRSHDSPTQPELPNKKVQVSKVEEQDNSMVEAVKLPRQSK